MTDVDFAANILLKLRREKRKRPRMNYNEECISKLKRAYLQDPKPDPAERYAISKETGLSYEQVTNWFTNSLRRKRRLYLRESPTIMIY